MLFLFRLIAIVNLVYIIVFTLHIFNFWKGVQIRQRGSVFTSRFGPPACPYPLVDLDQIYGGPNQLGHRQYFAGEIHRASA
jgi:hypothetical protein